LINHGAAVAAVQTPTLGTQHLDSPAGGLRDITARGAARQDVGKGGRRSVRDLRPGVVSTEPAFSNMVTTGFADDVVELWQHASMVLMTAATARTSAASKVTWLDPKLWLFCHRDPECTCDFEHCVSGRGWGTAWSSLRDGATDLA